MKTTWIIDTGYLMRASPGKFDYLKLKLMLEEINGEPFFETYYLHSTTFPPSDAQESFHTWLKTAGPRGPKMRVQLYDLKPLHLKCPDCRHEWDILQQKGVDVGIATLVIKLAAQNQYDRLILSAGDGDFEDAIMYVKSELHKQIFINGFMDSVSSDLQSYADNVIWMDEIWNQVKKEDPEEKVLRRIRAFP